MVHRATVQTRLLGRIFDGWNEMCQGWREKRELRELV